MIITVNRFFSKSIKRELSSNSINDNRNEEKKVKSQFVEQYKEQERNELDQIVKKVSKLDKFTQLDREVEPSYYS